MGSNSVPKHYAHPDTLSAISFQLTAGARLSKNHTVTVDASVAKRLSTAVMSAESGEGPSDFTNLTEDVKEKCGRPYCR